MFYISLTRNRVAVKVATCFFMKGNVEFIEYKSNNNNSN